MMHMQGIPEPCRKILFMMMLLQIFCRWFGERIVRLQSVGVKDIIIDPGFGFGKTADHNFKMLRRLSDFSVAGLPVTGRSIKEIDDLENS